MIGNSRILAARARVAATRSVTLLRPASPWALPAALPLADWLREEMTG